MKDVRFRTVAMLCLALWAANAGAWTPEIIIGWRDEPVQELRFGKVQLRAVPLVSKGVLPRALSRVQATDGALAETLRRLRADPRVAFAEPNYPVQLSMAPDDPRYPEQWHLPAVNAEAAWIQNGGDCSNVVIALVDTGVQLDHPDLQGNLWVNPGEIAGNSFDDDGNGVVDDVHGFNAITGSGSPVDDHGHGTHVAGIAAALGNNTLGASGLCQRAQLMPLKFLDRWGGGGTADAVKAIEYAIAHRPTPPARMVLNNSWVITNYSQALAEAVAAAESAGILVVAAAGNAGRDNDLNPYYPANLRNAYDHVVSVANLTQAGALYAGSLGSSNFGLSSVDLGAPGTAILSTQLNSSYGLLTGTSMATPVVSALAALIWQADPALAPAQVKARILRNVGPLPALAGKLLVPGQADAAAAVNDVASASATLFRPLASPTPGQALSVSGEGLGAIGAVSLAGTPMAIQGVSELALNLQLPPSARSGYLETDASNRLWLDVALFAPDQVLADRMDDGVMLSWNSPSNAAQIDIERAGEGSGYQSIASVSAPTAVYKDTAVGGSATACYRLRASYPYNDPVTGQPRTRYSEYSPLALLDVDPAHAQWLTQSVRSGTVGQAYATRLYATGSGVQFRLQGPDGLPPGLTLSPSGALTGAPLTAGSYRFTVLAVPFSGCPEQRELVVDVGESGAAFVEGGGRYSVETTAMLSEFQLRRPTPSEPQVVAGVDVLELGLAGVDGAALVDITATHLGNAEHYVIHALGNDGAWYALRGLDGYQAGYGSFSWALADGDGFDRDAAAGQVSVLLAVQALEPPVVSPEPPAAAAGGDRRCFIASTVYDNVDSPQLQTLRRFRDTILARTAPGRALIEGYYRHSPRLAHWLAQHPSWQPPIRLLLDGLVWILNHSVLFVAGFLLVIIGLWRAQGGRAYLY